MKTAHAEPMGTDTGYAVGGDVTADAAPAIVRRAHGQHGPTGIEGPAPGGELPRSASALPRHGVGSAVKDSAP